MFTLIVWSNLSLKWQVFIDSVNFIVYICDIKKWANISLSATERNSKVTSVANFISSKFWIFSQDVSKVLCSHCPNNDSSGCFTWSFTLQLCHKPYGILQMFHISKFQKIHISKDDGLPNFGIWILLNIGSGFPRVAGIRPSPPKILNLSINMPFIL